MTKPEDTPTERPSPSNAGATRPYAAKAADIARDLDRVIDRLQVLAVEVEDGRDAAVISVCDTLLDAKHRLRRTIQLLNLT